MSSVHLWAWPGNIWQFRLSFIIPSVKIVNTENLSHLSLLSKKSSLHFGENNGSFAKPIWPLHYDTGTYAFYVPCIRIHWEHLKSPSSRNASDQSKDVISHQFWTKALISLTKSCIFQSSWRFNWSTDGTHLRIWNWWILEGCDFTYDKYIL